MAATGLGHGSGVESFVGGLLRARLTAVLSGGQVVLQRVPERFQIDAVVLMPQPIADAADLRPRQSWAEPRRILLQPDGCLADHE
jgi:hypothetical protein